MKIGLIIYGSLDTVSGGYLYDRRLVEYLRGQGETVEVISLPWRRYSAHLMDNCSAGWKAQLRQQCQGLDLLLQDELNHPSLFWINQWLRREFPVPIISIVHHLRSSEDHPPFALALYRQVERAYLRMVDGFVFNSATTKASVEAMLGRSVDGVVAYPAADHMTASSRENREKRTSAEVEQPALNILFVGNVSARKGVHTLLDALAKLPPTSAVLNIVGSLDEQPYFLKVHHQAQRLDLFGRVEFLDRVTDEELSLLYQESDVLAVPSYEGFGIVYLEAMGFGLPVIGSTAGAAHEIITHGEDGFLVSPDDSSQLAEHLLALHQDRDRLARMSKAALNRYANHPTWVVSMAQIHRWIRETYEQKG